MVRRLGYNGANGRYGLLVSDLWEDTGFHCGGVSGGHGGWHMGSNQNGDVSRTEMVSGRHALLWESGICSGENMKRTEQPSSQRGILELCDKYSIDWMRK